MSPNDLKLGIESGTPLEEINVQLNLENVQFSSGYRGNAVMRINTTDANLQIKDTKRKAEQKPKKGNKRTKVEKDDDY